VTDAQSYLSAARRRSDAGSTMTATITRLPNVTLQQCTKTGKSFYARPLIRTDPKNPSKKEFFCVICLKANRGKPYRNRLSWHYIPTSRRGYEEQAVLTAIAANPGANLSRIAEYCQTRFLAGETYKKGNSTRYKKFNFTNSNVNDIIYGYRARGMIFIGYSGYKNGKNVY
jgi:hypothetical protein